MPPSADNPTPDPSPACPDEWLSAYVDGELTDDQRAAVETRLAGDAAAQRMVDGFRRLSEEFGGLPDDPAPAGIAEGVADRLKPLELSPRVEGRSWRFSVRRWGWAAAAVAAALVLMLFDDRPAVGPIAKRAAEAAGDPAEPDRTTLDQAEPLRGTRETIAQDPPAPTATAPPELRALASASAVPSAETPFSGSVDTAGAGAGTAGSLPPQAVVRLRLPTRALTNGAFDRVLVSNRIAVEASPPPRGVVSQLAAVGIELQPAEERDASKELAPPPRDLLGPSFFANNTGALLPKGDDEVEFVLVDAAAPVVERCLVDFNGDTSNFVRLKVESADTLNRGRRSLADSTNAAYQLQQRRVEPWFSYSRGELAKATRQRAASPRGAAPRRAETGRAAGAANEASGFSDSGTAKRRAPPAGRAYRFVNRSDDQAERRASRARAYALQPTEPLGRRANDETAGAGPLGADRVQVLFVLESSDNN